MTRFFIIVIFLFTAINTLSAREERVRFNLKLGFIKGGEAEVVIRDTFFNGKPAYHYYVAGKTTGLANSLYGVYDIYETTVDAETYLPLKSIRNIKEGNYRRYNETLYYHDVDSIYSQRSGWRKVPENLVDIISVFFYFIHNTEIASLAPGDAFIYPTYNADKISDVKVKFLREEEVETDIGKIDCIVIGPDVDKGKLFKRSNALKFYISKVNKIPVLLDFEMKVGSLKAVLKSYTVDGVEQISK